MVRDIVPLEEQPENIMVVFEMGDRPSGGTRPRDEDLGAILLELSGDRLKLLAQGSPINLLPVDAENPNAKRLDLIACPIA